MFEGIGVCWVMQGCESGATDAENGQRERLVLFVKMFNSDDYKPTDTYLP